ncbi:hypothetical protein BS17DRAFT_812889 [Gyrodon lividus]|nr:hypothetical protein BS17DRAFT_812889 [Gyrodon lividus]
MFSTTNNDLSQWNNEQLHEHDNNDNELFEKKSAEQQQQHMKAWKEAEHWRAEEEARQKAEEKSLVVAPTKGKQLRVSTSRVGPTELVGGLTPCFDCVAMGVTCEMKMQAARGVAANAEEKMRGGCVAMGWQEEGTDDKEDEEWVEGENDCNVLGAAMVAERMQNMAADQRHIVAESHVQMERMLDTLEEIWGCPDLEFSPEEEVVEATAEREGWKSQSGEEVEVEKEV